MRIFKRKKQLKKKKFSPLQIFKVVLVLVFPILGVSMLAREVYDYSSVMKFHNIVDDVAQYTNTSVVAGAVANISSQPEFQNKAVVPTYRVGVISDSHNQNDLLSSAIESLVEEGVDKIVHLGDLTDWGELDKLAQTKETLDKFEVAYVAIPGDHDLGETRDASNFLQIFGVKKGFFELGPYKFIYFDNSLNFTKLTFEEMRWFEKEVKEGYIVFLSQPLVSKDMTRVMGIIDEAKDLEVFSQNEELLNYIRSSDVKVIVAGDLHLSSQYEDPVKPSLWHISAGALLKSESIEKLNLQSPRVGMLEIYDDSSWIYKDIVL